MPEDFERVIAEHLHLLGDQDADHHARGLASEIRMRTRQPRLALVDPERIDPEIGMTTSNSEYGW